jgi:hypothetical protein
MARRRPYDFKVDSWAAGVVAYMLLAGEPPFADWDAIADGRDSTREGLLRAIRRGRPVVPVDDIPQLSPGAKSLLKSLLEPNPEKRMSCQNASEHYWVRERGAASHADSLASAVVERLQAYGTLGAVRRACTYVSSPNQTARGLPFTPVPVVRTARRTRLASWTCHRTPVLCVHTARYTRLTLCFTNPEVSAPRLRKRRRARFSTGTGRGEILKMETPTAATR